MHKVHTGNWQFGVPQGSILGALIINGSRFFTLQCTHNVLNVMTRLICIFKKTDTKWNSFTICGTVPQFLNAQNIASYITIYWTSCMYFRICSIVCRPSLKSIITLVIVSIVSMVIITSRLCDIIISVLLIVAGHGTPCNLCYHGNSV